MSESPLAPILNRAQGATQASMARVPPALCARIYLLADSRLLFWSRPNGSLFLKEMVQATGAARPSAAYIGASNDDNAEFYHGIFEPAMQQVECGECRMILKRPSTEDAKFLERAEIILLAGGSVEKGWRAFEQNGFRELIPRCWLRGAVLVGVSAGAVQLGQGWVTEDGTLLQMFRLLPFFVGAHEEEDDWASLRRVVNLAAAPCQGIGLPFGGGAVYYAGELEPIAKPIFELVRNEQGVRESLAFPAGKDANATPAPVPSV